MSEFLNSAREVIAEDLLARMTHEGVIGSIGAWITVDGVDVWVTATHEDCIESQSFHDDTPTGHRKQPQMVLPFPGGRKA